MEQLQLLSFEKSKSMKSLGVVVVITNVDKEIDFVLKIFGKNLLNLVRRSDIMW